MQTNDPISNFFTFLEARRIGIFVLLWVLVVAVFLLQWLVWIFARGRFKRQALPLATGTGTGTGDGGTASARPVYYVFSEAIVKIIDDFRHLLALIIVVIFAIALMFVLIQARPDIGAMKEALTAVTGTLGGLVGSIIGYYFGESSVINAVGGDGGAGGGGTAGAAVQGAPDTSGGGKAADIKKAPKPPGAGGSGSGSGGASSGAGTTGDAKAKPIGNVDTGAAAKTGEAGGATTDEEEAVG